MKNKDKKTFKVISLWLMALLFLAMAPAMAQTFEIEAHDAGDEYTSEPGDYEVGEDNLQVRTINFSDNDPDPPFEEGDKFYFYYGTEGDLDTTYIIDGPRSYRESWINDGINFMGTIDEIGLFELFVGHFTGRFDYDNPISNEDVEKTMGTDDDDFAYDFNNSGSRSLTTTPLTNLALNDENEGDVMLEVTLEVGVNWWEAISEEHAIVIKYSTNGTSWTWLEDTNDDEEFWGWTGSVNLNFELPSAALDENTKFRVRQLDANDLADNAENWSLASMAVYKGDGPINHDISEQVPGVFDIMEDPDQPQLIDITVYDSDDAVVTNNWWGNPAYPGDDVTIEVNTQNMTHADYIFYVEFAGENYLIPNDDIEDDQANNDLIIDFSITVNIPDFYNSSNHPITVKAVDGDEIIEGGTGLDPAIDLIADYVDDENISESGEKNGSSIEFTGAGERYFFTNPENVHTHPEAKLSFDLIRTSDPPSEQLIRLEYSIDGNDWTQLGDDAKLGGESGAGTDGITIELVGDELDGIASSTTQFRIRQLEEGNGTGINTWKVENFSLFVPDEDGNVIDDITDLIHIAKPSFTIDLEDKDQIPYPGNIFTIEVDNIEGELPEGTLYEVYYGDIWLKTFSNLGNFDITLPLDEGFKQIEVRAEVKDDFVESNEQNITIQPVELSITDWSIDYQDGEKGANIPGNEIEVYFDTENEIDANNLDASVVLQVKIGVDPDTNDDIFETIAVEPYVNAFNDGGSISGILPDNYDYGDETNIKVFIQNPTEDSDVLFDFSQELERATTNWEIQDALIYYLGNFDEGFNAGTKIAFNIYLDGEEDGEAELVYRMDGEWVPFENGTLTITPDMKGYVTHYANIDDFIFADELIDFEGDLYVGVKYPDIDNSNISVEGVRIIEPTIRELGEDTDEIIIVYPSITLETLDDTDFIFGSSMNLEYTSFAFDNANAHFALVIEQDAGTADHVYHVLAESADVEGELSFEFPSRGELEENGFEEKDPATDDFSFDVNLRMYAYSQDVYNELLLPIENLPIELDLVANDGDFIEIEGHDGNEFGEDGDRYAITRALDLSNMADPVSLHFDYQANIQTPNTLTLPYLQVSTDGGQTFSTIVVEESPYAHIERLPANGNTHNFVVEIHQDYLASATNFRWIQDVTTNNGWNISNIGIYSGTNLVDFVTTYYPDPQGINLDDEELPYDANDFDLYDWELVEEGLDEELDPVIEVEEAFTFNWLVNDAYIDDETGEVDDDLIPAGSNLWPEGTKFEFFILWDNPEAENPGADDDEENYFLFATITGTGELIVADSLLPAIEDLPTGYYDVYARASLYNDDDEIIHGSHYNMDDLENTYPLKKVTDDGGTDVEVLVINETTTQEDILQLVVSDLPNEDPATDPEFYTDEEFTIEYEKFGPWDENAEFAATLEQYDNGTNSYLDEARIVLETISSAEGELTVEMPAYVEEHDDMDEYRVRIYAHEGGDIEFGLSLDENDMEFETEGNDPWNFIFYKEGKRYAITKELDLSEVSTATITFDYDADDILENTATLPRLEVTTDGETFHALEVGDGYGAMGYLPADTDGNWESFDVEIPAAYLTETTQIRFKQSVTFTANEDIWGLNTPQLITDSNILIYEEDNNEQEVDFMQPDVDDYEWLIVRDADGFEPAFYRGNEVEFTWEMGLDDNDEPIGIEYPAGTVFEFFLKNYPEAGDYWHIEFTETANDTFEFTLPDDIDGGAFEVAVEVSLDDFVYVPVDDEDPTIDDKIVRTLRIFNPELITDYEHDEVLYAGNNATFTGIVENEATELNPDYYYNLILIETGGDQNEWLLAEQQGSTEFDVQIPSFVNQLSGGFSFQIEASLDNPMGVIGELIERPDPIELDVTNDFEGNYLDWNPVAGMDGSYGDQVILLTQESHDLSEIHAVEFEVWVTELELTDKQKLKLEYSVDGKTSWTEVDFYPNDDYEEYDVDNPDWTEEFVILPEGARTEETYLRWSIEEYYEPFGMQNIALVPFAFDYRQLPIEYVAATPNVSDQRIDITATDDLEYCNNDIIELDYNIRGKFGEDVVMTLYSDGGAVQIDGEDVTYEGITDGSGTIELDMGMLDDPLSGTDVNFHIQIDDLTLEEDGYDFTLWSNLSEPGIDIIPEFANILLHAQSLWETEHESCAGEERIVIIETIEENFSYQLRDYVTGDPIGDPVIVDVEDDDLMDADTYPYYDDAFFSGSLEISIGEIEEKTKIEVEITALDSSGELVCGVEIPAQQVTFDVRPLYTLHYDLNNTGVWKEVEEDQEFTICESSTDLKLSMVYYKDGDEDQKNVDWYRDDESKPLGGHQEYDNFTVSGTYFAIVDDGECGEYESIHVDVVVNEKPDQPTITVDGETQMCDGETTTLIATEGYEYYRWRRDNVIFGAGNSQSIEVEEEGSYQVEVSNVPFDVGCYSAESNPVYIEVFEFNDNVEFTTWTQGTSTISGTGNRQILLSHKGDSIAKVTINNLQEDVNYYLVDYLVGDTIQQFASNSSWKEVKIGPLDNSVTLEIHAANKENSECIKVVSENTLSIEFLDIAYSTFQIDGEWERIEEDAIIETCEDEVRLSIGRGNDDNYYLNQPNESVVWYKDGVNYRSFGQWDDPSITISESGVYHSKFIDENVQNEEDSYLTEPVEVIIGEKPARPELTHEGELEFCEGEGDLVLIAPGGYDAYEWQGPSLNITSDDNELHVVRTGRYRVRVINEQGCESALSTSVDATVHAKPDKPVGIPVDDVLCEPGVANIQLDNINMTIEDDVMYQLFDVITGEELSDPKMGSSNLVIPSYVLDDDAMIEIRATRLDVDGCDMVSNPIEVIVHNLQIQVSGNTLIASIAPYHSETNITGATSYQWYRNGEIINNSENNRTLNIYDDAEYTVVVNTIDGCILETEFSLSKDATAVSDLEESSDGLTVYPNPAQDNINIKYSSVNEEKLYVRILNINGEIVWEDKLHKSGSMVELEHQISVNSLNNGTYIIQVVGNESVKVKQFVKF